MTKQELNRWRAITAGATILLGIGIIISACCVFHNMFASAEAAAMMIFVFSLVVIIVAGLCWFLRDLQVRSVEDNDIRELLENITEVKTINVEKRIPGRARKHG